MAGKLVIIGGAEDRQRHCTILKTVLELSGEERPRVVVVAAASAEPESTGQNYDHVFAELGAETVRVLKLNARSEAQDAAALAPLQEATAVFISGGDQLRLTGILGGTELLRRLRSRFQEGLVVAGTSAGASAMSGTMIVGGSAGTPPRRGLIQMAPGLGFLPRVLIDQHFTQRGRFGRLMAAVALNPSMLGLGIDEDTAVVVSDNRWLEVIGSAGVTIIDGSTLEYAPVSETAPEETLTLSSFRLHVLARGAKFDLSAGRLHVAG